MKCLAFSLGIILLKFTHMIAQLLDHSHLLVCSIPLYLEASGIVIRGCQGCAQVNSPYSKVECVQNLQM